jgi:hypothetical protein
MDDPFLDPPSHQSYTKQRLSPVTGLPFTVSSPKVSQLFNIFHPSDPISYRLEPLISPVMTTLKPQALPYTKKGIFGSVAQQGLTGIGAKVGQSVSGFWSSLSAGIASNLLNRSLGLSSEDVAKITAEREGELQLSQQGHVLSPGAGTNVSAGVIPADGGGGGGGGKVLSDKERSEKTAERMRMLAVNGGRESGKEATLIDDELETLFSRFQKNRVDMASSSSSGKEKDGGKDRGPLTLSHEKWVEEERKAQRLRREEMKIRALNRNGRVDYCIQE